MVIVLCFYLQHSILTLYYSCSHESKVKDLISTVVSNAGKGVLKSLSHLSSSIECKKTVMKLQLNNIWTICTGISDWTNRMQLPIIQTILQPCVPCH